MKNRAAAAILLLDASCAAAAVVARRLVIRLFKAPFLKGIFQRHLQCHVGESRSLYPVNFNDHV